MTTVMSAGRHVKTFVMRAGQMAGLTVGERIAELRRSWGRRHGKRMTQAELARRVGVHRGTVAAWESGSQEPTGKNLIALARVLETTPEMILGRPVEPDECEGPERPREIEEGFESLLYSKAALYQTLSDFGPPGHRTDDKLSLIDLLSKVAADLKREGKRLPTEILSQAHADILNGEI